MVNWSTTRTDLNLPVPLLVVVLPFNAWIGLKEASTVDGYSPLR